LFDTGFIYLTMIVDLTAIEGLSRPFDFSIPPGDIDVQDGGVRLIGTLRATGEVIKKTAQIDVTGSIQGEAEIDCTRCLGPVKHDLNIRFAVSFVTPEDFAADKEREVQSDDLDTDVLDDDRLDLKEVIREQVLLNLPVQVFCRPDCKGLCPKCGSDRNLINCSCDEDEVDPRWAALRNLKGK
jgi:uncharacterized protein